MRIYHYRPFNPLIARSYRSDLDTGKAVFDATVGMTGMRDVDYPKSQADWFIMGTSDYISRAHVDAEGCYTVVGVGAGGKGPAGKLWFVGIPREERFRMKCTTAFPEEFGPSRSNKDVYRWEAIWLGANDYV